MSNLEAKTIYENYSSWCKANGFGVENKKNFFDELKAKNLLSESGTVNGKTVRNVVKGYKIEIDFREEALPSTFTTATYNPFE